MLVYDIMSFVSLYFWSLWATNLILEACIIDDTCFVRRKSGCLLPMHGFWRILGWGCSKKTAEKAKKPFQAEFSQQGSCCWHATAPAKNMAQKSIRKKLQVHQESFHFFSSNQPEDTNLWIKLSAQNGLLPLKKKTDKNPCDFLSEAQTPFLISMTFALGVFLQPPAVLLSQNLFFPQVCCVFFWFSLGKIWPSKSPAAKGKKPAMIFRKKLAVNFVKQEKIKPLKSKDPL